MDPMDKGFKLDKVSIRLVKDAPLMSTRRIKTPLDAVEVLGKELCELDREVLCVVNLKANGHPINCHIASMGALNEALAHPRDLLKSSILSNAAQMVLMHNHVSGTLNPSEADVQLTDRMARVCKLIGIQLVDHIIVGGDNTEYFSFMEKNIMPFPNQELEKDYKNLELPEQMVAEEAPTMKTRRHR